MSSLSTSERRRLGRSDLLTSVVGLGGNTFGPPRLDGEATGRVIHAALDLGVNFIDTAAAYGGGESERLIGEALGSRRDEMIIATKVNFFGLGDESGSARIRRQAEESLQKLRTDRIDLLQVHFPSAEVRPGEILSTLDDLVSEGKVRAIGACNYSSWRLAEALYLARELGTTTFVTVQNYYHLLARQSEAEVARFCDIYGLRILPYHPLGGGFLTGKYRQGEPPPPGSRGAAGSPIVSAMSSVENWDRLARLEEFAAQRGHTMGELAIAWLLANPLVGSVIAGVSNPEQLAANVRAAEWQLTAEEKDEVDAIVGGVPDPERPPYA